MEGLYEHNAHINAARRVLDKQLRCDYILRQVKNGGDFRYLGLTKKSLGPPVNLNKTLAEEWELEVNRCLIKCINNIYLPAQINDLRREKEFFSKVVKEKSRTLEEDKLISQIRIGMRRASVKWNKRGYGEKPRDRELDNLENRVGIFDESEIGSLKRGEVDVGECKELILDKSIDSNKDLYKLLSHSIYGKSKFRNLIFRCIDKYLCKYEEREKTNFKPHWGVLCNGEYKWIRSWYMMRALINNRDICFSTYELDIVSILYDINIRIYVVDGNNVLRCIWKSGRRSLRVINVFNSTDNNWSLLVCLNNNKEGRKNERIDVDRTKINYKYTGDKLDSNFSLIDSHEEDHAVNNVNFSRQDSLDSLITLDTIDNSSCNDNYSIIESQSDSDVSCDNSKAVLDSTYALINRQAENKVSFFERDSSVSLQTPVKANKRNNSHDNNFSQIESQGSEVSRDNRKFGVDSKDSDYTVGSFYRHDSLDSLKSWVNTNNGKVSSNHNFSQIVSQDDSDDSSSIVTIGSIENSSNSNKFFDRSFSSLSSNNVNSHNYYNNPSNEVEVGKKVSMINDNTQNEHQGNNAYGGRLTISSADTSLQTHIIVDAIDKSNYSDWSLILSDSENEVELVDIEDKVNRQAGWSNIGLNLSNITITTYSSTDGKIEEEYREDIIKINSNNNMEDSGKKHSEWQERKDRVQITNRVGQDNNNDSNRVEGDTYRRFEDKEIIVYSCDHSTNKTGSYERIESQNYNSKINLNISRDDKISSNSMSSIDDDIKWLFEDRDKIEERNSYGTNRLEVSKDNDIQSNILDSFLDSSKTESSTSKEYITSSNSRSSIDHDIEWSFEDRENGDSEYDYVADKNDKEQQINILDGYDKDRGTVNSNVEVDNRVESEDSNDCRLGRQLSKTLSQRRLFWCKWKNMMRNKERNKIKKEDRNLEKEGIQQKNIEAVFDYSSKGLDRIEIEFLSKGSTFCVANNKIDEDRFKADIYAYSRRLRLHEEFREQGPDTDYSQLFSQIIQNQGDSQISQNNSQIDRQCRKKAVGRRLPSMYDPDSQNRNLARYCSCIQEESMLAIKSKVKFRDNVSIDHRQALNTLKKKVEDRDIVITLADKGSGIVVVDYDKYIEKGTHYIEVEAKAYSVTQKPHKQIVADIVKERNKIVRKLKELEVIEVETATYCMKQLEEKITGMKFYYKVHKDTNIATMPVRPLQSCIGAPTQHLSQVLTDILQPFLTQQYIPTFIQDSNQLLYRLESLGKLDSTSTLISSDVSALYPSIPHKEGLEAVQAFLEEFSSFTISQIKYIMQALKLVITQNFVMWNGNIYTQDSGVAMGTPVAVAYANIFMHWIDTLLSQRASYIIEHIRYIDDNLFIIPEDKIEETMRIANSLLVPHIKFTYEKLDKDADVGLPFLDTQLFISKTLTIESRLYTKKTDKHTYLLPTSFHPSHITKNIPQAVFNRIRRICSSLEWYRADASKAIQWLIDRGYKFADIKKAVDNSSSKDRWTMINKIEENRGNKRVSNNKQKAVEDIPLIVTYSHNSRLLREVLKNRQPLLDASFNTTKAKPRLAFRRQRNISDILIQKGLRAPIVGNITLEQTLSRCDNNPKYRIPCPCKGNHDQQVCRCCVHLKLKLDNIAVKIHKSVNCESRNLVYVIGCKICNKLYVGETQQQLRERFLQHLNNIQKFSQPLYIHFNRVHKAENIFISVLETVKSNEHVFRKIREAWWINKLQTLEPTKRTDSTQTYGFHPTILCYYLVG